MSMRSSMSRRTLSLKPTHSPGRAVSGGGARPFALSVRADRAYPAAQNTQTTCTHFFSASHGGPRHSKNRRGCQGNTAPCPARTQRLRLPRASQKSQGLATANTPVAASGSHRAPGSGPGAGLRSGCGWGESTRQARCSPRTIILVCVNQITHDAARGQGHGPYLRVIARR